MNNKTFKDMEQRLFNYFNKDKRLSVLNKRLEILEKQISEIEYKLKNIDVNLPEESRAIGYDERVQTSPTGESYAERTLLRITDKLLKEQSWKKEQVVNIEETIRNIEADNTFIEANIKDLRVEDQEFLKEKYKYGKKDWQLGMKFGISQQAATERKKKLIENIANWEDWVGGIRV